MAPATAGGEPDDGPAGDVRSRLAAHLAAPPGARRRLHTGDGWLYLQDPRMPELGHGWKLHLSARPDQLPDLVDLVLPVLLGRTCDAKFAASTAVLHQLNSGLRGAAGVGKAVTVYPAPEEAGPLAAELAEVLAGRTGPRVVSDRRLRPDTPVYYRYGPFRVSGDDPDLVMTGPDGRTFPGLAEPAYRQPPWAADPFTAADPTADPTAGPTGDPTGGPAQSPSPTTRVGDGRYRLTAGITRSPNGHVYRAVEVAGGREVVVKQARAFVAEDRSGTDARGRLRHERRVLAALAGVPGVPDLVDYFRHGEDEYLVSTARGPRDLRRAVLEAGPYDVLGDRAATTAPGTGTGPGPGRDWWALARGLLAVLDAVHARGVVVHDLKPANVVLDGAGGCSLVDFGVSSLNGERPEGTTLGYALPATAGPDTAGPDTAGSHPADDYYALGATLHWAATGLDPVVIDPDPAVNRERTLACLAAALPAPPAPLARPADAVVDLVAGLLSPDAEVRSAAAAGLRQVPAEPGARPAAPGIRPATPAPPPRTAHRPPVVTADLLDRAVRHTLDRCVRMARDLAHDLADGRPDASPGAGLPSRPRALLSRYDGAAGLGLELLQHPDRPEVRDAAAGLARWTAAHPALGRLGPGLYDGRAGVDLFLAQAAHLLGTEPVGTEAAAIAADRFGELPTDLPADLPADQVSGAAGLGTARLLLARLARADGRPEEAARHTAVAAACARRLTDGRPTDPREAPNPGTAALVEGFAHGRAGLAHFLLALPATDAGTAEAARRLVDGLAEDVPRLVTEARAPGATRRYGSWCRGLAGLGSVLLQAGRLYREPALVTRAAEAAAAALVPAPRTGPVGQCCGLAGLGELLVDLAVATGDERHWRSAEKVAGLILARAGGPYDRPLLPGGDPSTESASWAAGTPGVLGFLRRLSRRGGPRPGTLFPA
ncbi:class IV lanthionine synthetase LanL [Kitasatospora sp. cg17-2]